MLQNDYIEILGEKKFVLMIPSICSKAKVTSLTASEGEWTSISAVLKAEIAPTTPPLSLKGVKVYKFQIAASLLPVTSVQPKL